MKQWYALYNLLCSYKHYYSNWMTYFNKYFHEELLMMMQVDQKTTKHVTDISWAKITYKISQSFDSVLNCLHRFET